jgi:hypothetical protein
MKLILLSAVLLVTATAHAAERQRSGTYQTSRGRSGTWQQNVERNYGYLKRDTQWTNQDGGTGTRTVEKHWDRETRTGDRTATTTLPNGKTFTTSGTITVTNRR